ncbi:MAG: gamma-glutamylcyclotransferase, partial [Acidobacteriota bacterium]|nr:gamma-glutamylcyclotransferase [Acidobacteriota bacterium]
ELRTAVLHGYARAWNTVGQVIFDDDEESSPVLFLGLALSRDGACNGLLAETEAAELPFLDRREKYYLRIDVTPWIELDRDGPIANAAIYTYVARPECFYDPVRDTLRWEGLGVAQGYRQLIEDGLAERPTEFADAFRRQTWPIPAGIETISRPYRFPDPEQNRATGRDRPAEDGGPARD